MGTLREIGNKFTKSELVLVAWRSQEQSYHFKQRLKKIDKGEQSITGKSGKKRKEYLDGIGPERMPDEFFNEEGDFDLSRVTGENARRYFEQVLRIPLPPGVSKIRHEDERSEQIRQAYGIRR